MFVGNLPPADLNAHAFKYIFQLLKECRKYSDDYFNQNLHFDAVRIIQNHSYTIM